MIYEELNWNVNLGHFKERIHRKEPLTSIIFGCIYQELDDCVLVVHLITLTGLTMCSLALHVGCGTVSVGGCMMVGFSINYKLLSRKT